MDTSTVPTQQSIVKIIKADRMLCFSVQSAVYINYDLMLSNTPFT